MAVTHRSCPKCSTSLLAHGDSAGTDSVQVAWVDPPTTTPRPGRRLIVTSIVAAAIVLAGLVYLPQVFESLTPASGTTSSPTAPSTRSSPSRSPIPTTEPAVAQARAIDSLLDASADARDGVRLVSSHIQNCESTEQDVRALHRAIKVRSDLARSAKTTAVDALPNGDRLRTRLSSMLELSADANRHYLAWQRAMADCQFQAYEDANFVTARRLSNAATKTKRQFVEEWNGVASKYGLPARSADEL